MIKLVKEKKDCTGCGACSLICPKNAIEMKPDKLGFLYPEIDNKKCVECCKCVKNCPVSIPLKENNFEIYGVKHKSKDVRLNSSSGGAFTALSDYVLSQGGSVYGAVFNDMFRVVYFRAENSDGRNRQRGSKYIQAEAFRSFEDVKRDIEKGQKVLFTGTPCQIAGLNAYLGKNYSNLILCDLICHGVASPAVWEDYICFINRKYGKFENYKFRDKDISWRGYNISVVKENGKKICNTACLKIAYEIYCSHLCTRESCHACHFTSTNRVSDITIGDFWGVEKSRKSFEDEYGVSIMMLNTEKGRDVFEQIKDNCDYVQIDVQDTRQPQLYHPSHAALNEKNFYNDYKKMNFCKLSKKYFGYGNIANLKRIVRKILIMTGIYDWIKGFLK